MGGRLAPQGDRVAQKDQFWTSLQRATSEAHNLLRWFTVETMVDGDFFQSLSMYLDEMPIVCEGIIHNKFRNLEDDVTHAMIELRNRNDRCLGPAASNDEVRETVLLVENVFRHAVDLFNKVGPFIQCELLEVVGGPPHGGFHERKYKFKDDDRDHNTSLAGTNGAKNCKRGYLSP